VIVMRRVISVILVLLILTTTLLTNSLSDIPQSFSQKIEMLTYYSNLKYNIEIKTIFKNQTTKNIYFIEYNVINSTGLNITVRISGNYTSFKNVTIINNGTYSINLITSLFSFKYPYIPLYLIFNNTYAIYHKNEYIIVSFQNYTKYLNNTAYLVRITTQNGSSYNVKFLENGIAAEINFTKTISNYTYNINMRLINLNNSKTLELPITFNTNALQYSYLYVIYNYSSLASNIIPQGYTEFVYPYILPGNYILQAQFRLEYIAGNKLLTPISIQDYEVNFVINIGKPDETFVPAISNFTNTISWNGYVLKKINQTKIEIFGKSYNTYLYLNLTNFTIHSGNSTIIGKRFVYVYFDSSNGTVVRFRVEASGGNITAPALQLDYIGRKYNDYYLNPLTTFPNVASYSNTNLPFNVISPNTSLAITMIITLIIVIIVVLLRRKI